MTSEQIQAFMALWVWGGVVFGLACYLVNSAKFRDLKDISALFAIAALWPLTLVAILVIGIRNAFQLMKELW